MTKMSQDLPISSLSPLDLPAPHCLEISRSRFVIVGYFFSLVLFLCILQMNEIIQCLFFNFWLFACFYLRATPYTAHDYSWRGSGASYGVAGIKSGLDMCQASTLSTVLILLLLYPLGYFMKSNIFQFYSNLNEVQLFIFSYSSSVYTLLY